MSQMSRLAQDILNQPASLRDIVAYHSGDGRAALARAARRIRQARHIVMTGMGGSLYSLQPCADMLVAAGFPAALIETSELLHYHRPPGADTVIVAVSRSGETVETAKLLPILRSSGAVTIGVTNVPGSALARAADETILIGSHSDELVAIQSYTGSLAVLLTLAAEVCGNFDRGWIDSLLLAAESMEGSVQDCMESSECWNRFFQSASCVYLLGRGPSVASTREGALLFHEAARFPAIHMSAGNFRHGSVEVVDDRFRAIVFSGQPSTKLLELSLADDLEAFGGQVVRVGPGQESPGSVPVVPTQFLPMLEIIPVQVAALRLAERQGIPPGQFRHGGLITQTEESFRTAQSADLSGCA